VRTQLADGLGIGIGILALLMAVFSGIHAWLLFAAAKKFAGVKRALSYGYGMLAAASAASGVILALVAFLVR